MKKQIIGILIGAAAYFFVGMALWTVIPWHDSVIKKLPEETLITDTMRVVIPDAGFYMFPSANADDGKKMPMTEWEDKYKKGPDGIVIYFPGGRAPMGARKFIVGIAESLGIAFFCMMMLSIGRNKMPSFGCRFGTVVALGVFVWFASYVPLWNWMLFPLTYIGIALLDTIVTFSVLGLILAKFAPTAGE